MSDPLEPKFPPELEESIFSFALHADWQNSVKLILVAKRVYYWLLPQIYEVVVFHSHRVENGRRPRCSSRNLVQYGKNARYIMFYNSQGPDRTGLHDTLTDCLSWCPNLIDVALWVKDELYEEVLVNQLLSLRQMTHLSWDFSAFQLGLAKFGYKPPRTFTNVTHLELIGSYKVVNPYKVQEYFPSLTHIAFTARGQTPIEALREVLNCFKDQIEVVIWYLGDSDDHPMPTVFPTSSWIRSDDPRIVVLDYGHDFVDTWYEGTRNGPSLWKVAEDTVKARRGIGTSDDPRHGSELPCDGASASPMHVD
ncbi:hypothetical protein BDN72DRAFT_835377 [Pluteus cervinus]|uniref:Uncharacterized protein n=1 Tax=Pluteus cervinus TaxID=181527 RepID=A0ACD3B5G8_9AGAR|nr:hypothetical protein BDN72DRAFT_835377 [Pluteus cervinus]